VETTVIITATTISTTTWNSIKEKRIAIIAECRNLKRLLNLKSPEL
jgi:hypothetical protein